MIYTFIYLMHKATTIKKKTKANVLRYKKSNSTIFRALLVGGVKYTTASVQLVKTPPTSAWICH